MTIPGVEHVAIAAAVKNAASQASKTMTDRIRFGLAKQGVTRYDNVIVGLDNMPGPHLGELTTLPLLDLLPDGVTNADVQRLVTSPTYKAATYQLIACHYYGVTDSRVERLVVNLNQYLTRELNSYLVQRGAQQRTASPQIATYLSALLAVTRQTCEAVATNLRLRVPRAPETVGWAAAQVSIAYLESIDQYLGELTAGNGRPTAEEIREKIEKYQALFVDHHSRISLPDMSNRMEVDCDKIFVDPAFTWSEENLVATGRAKEHVIASKPLWDLEFPNLLDGLDRVVILGDPGAGKSTASAMIALRWTKEGHGTAFYVRLREVSFDQHGFDLVTTLTRILASRYQLPISAGMIEAIISIPDTLIVFDGLDEVLSPGRRLLASKVIEDVARRYPFTRIVVTSRKIGYAAVRLHQPDFVEYILSPFTPKQTEAYAKKWFTRVSGGDERIVTASVNDLMRRSNGIVEIRSNPLMLALICLIYRGIRTIPRSRPDIYRRCLDLLLYEIDLSKELQDYTPHIEQFRFALSEIAYATFITPALRGEMTETKVRAIATGSFTHVVPSDAMAYELAAKLVRHCRGRAWIFTDAGLDDVANDVFGFTHECFREYLAAGHLVRSSTDAKEIANRIIQIASVEQAEVLGQSAVCIAQETASEGSSNVVIELLSAPVQKQGALLEFVARATDSAMINRHALKTLVDHLMREPMNQGWRTVLDHDYRYREPVQELAYRAWSEMRVSDPRHAGDLADIAWFWELLITSKSCSSTEVTELFRHVAPQELYERIFRGSLGNFSRDHDVPTFFSWIIATVCDPKNRAAAVTVLRAVANFFDRCPLNAMTGISDPSFSYILSVNAQAVAPVLTKALRIAAGFDHEVLSGMVYLAMGFVEVVEQFGSGAVNITPFPGVDLGSARGTGKLLPGMDRLTPNCRYFLGKWLKEGYDRVSIFVQSTSQLVS